MLEKLAFNTHERIEFIDITEKINSIVYCMDEGFVNLFVQHTTAALCINEAEAGLLYDIKLKVQNIFKSTEYYAHDDFKKRNCAPGERRNGHSHLQAMLFQPSLTIPIYSGKLLLGEYQSVFLVELDGPREKRTVIVQVYENPKPL